MPGDGHPERVAEISVELRYGGKCPNHAFAHKAGCKLEMLGLRLVATVRAAA